MTKALNSTCWGVIADDSRFNSAIFWTGGFVGRFIIGWGMVGGFDNVYPGGIVGLYPAANYKLTYYNVQIY